MGPFNFSAQHRQLPERPEGATFKRKWLRIVNRLPRPSMRGGWLVSIDTALSTLPRPCTLLHPASTYIVNRDPRGDAFHAPVMT